MNDIQKLQLDMLIKLDEVCEKHKLRYYLAYGTCIGAVREKGFIPWDHDIDVLMPIDDAERLARYQDELSDRYFFSSYKTDKEYHYTNMRLSDLENKVRIYKNGKVIEEDLAIDIYPFYNCPPSRIGLLLNVWRSHIYKMLVGGIPENHGKVGKIIGKIVLVFCPMKSRKKKILHLENKLRYNGQSNSISDYFGQDVSLCNAITYNRKWFDKPQKLLFEGKYFNGPTNYHAYLTKRYGDYMTPPKKTEIDAEAKLELITKKEN